LAVQALAFQPMTMGYKSLGLAADRRGIVVLYSVCVISIVEPVAYVCFAMNCVGG